MKTFLKKFFVFFATVQLCYFGFLSLVSAQDATDVLWDDGPKGGISISTNTQSTEDGVVNLLVYAQGFLLKVVLPIVAIGSMIYIAYELLTAEGDDGKMKKAWKAIVYAIVAIIAIMLSALIVRVISGLDLS